MSVCACVSLYRDYACSLAAYCISHRAWGWWQWQASSVCISRAHAAFIYLASLLIHILHAPNFSSFCVHLCLLSSLLAALLFISTLRAGKKKDSNSFYAYTFSFHILFPAFVYSPSPFCSQTAHPLFLSPLCLSFLVIYAHHPAIVIFCLSVFITAASLTVWANPQKSNNAICSYILIYRHSNESIFMRLGGEEFKEKSG